MPGAQSTKKVPLDQDAGARPARRPRVTGSAGGGRRRIGLIRRANSHRKGQHVRPVLPERVCGSDATRRDKPSGSQFSPLGRTAPSEHPSDQVGSQSRFRTGPAERRPSEARPTNDRSDRLATSAVRDVSGLPAIAARRFAPRRLAPLAIHLSITRNRWRVQNRRVTTATTPGHIPRPDEIPASGRRQGTKPLSR